MKTTTFRLTLWYVLISALISSALFGVLYITLVTNLARRVDDDLREDVVELITHYRNEGLESITQEFTAETNEEGIGHAVFLLFSPNNELLAHSDLSMWNNAEADLPGIPSLTPGQTELTTVELRDRGRTRFITSKSDDGTTLRIGELLEEDQDLMETYRTTFAITLAVSVLCSGVVGWLLATRAMAGVKRVANAARNVRKDSLSQRVPLGNEGQEIQQLATAFNTMLERIDTLVTNLSQVTDDIAHDMRSPITRIRGAAETALAGPEDLNAYRDMAASVIEESDRLTEMIQSILEVARADSGTLVYDRIDVDITQVVADGCELFDPVTEDKQIHLSVTLPDQPAWVLGDVGRLQRAVANLLDNAIQHTPAHGRIDVSVSLQDTNILITIADTGTGIDPDVLPHIFERFYRGDPSRSNAGHGLGLSLVKVIIKNHQGQIQVKTQPQKGTTFTITLPRIQPEPH